MATNTKQCPICGSLLKEEGADATMAYYRCPGCGDRTQVPLGEGGRADMAMRKRELLGRIRAGFIDWRVTQWDRLHMDLVDFSSRYDEAQMDIQLQMGILACMTKGFNSIDAEKYQQCKKLFKFTERVYKQQLKVLKKQMDPSLYESVNDYKDARVKYMKCRDEYRSTKLAWKLIFFLLKKAVLH